MGKSRARSGLVERGPFDVETGGFQPLHDIVDRFRIASFALDLDDGVIGRKSGENPAVVDFDDVDARFVKFRGDRGECAGAVLSRDMKPRDAPATDEIADETIAMVKGAMAEPLASTSSTPTATSVMTMGASQNFLFSLMNCHSSLMTCAFDIAFSLATKGTK